MSSFNALLNQFKSKHGRSVVKETNTGRDDKSHANTDADDNDNTARKRFKFEPPSNASSSSNNDNSNQSHPPAPLGNVKAVYLLCPANTTTGGPEAMHQLCDMFFQCQKKKEEEEIVSCEMIYVTIVDGHPRIAMSADVPVPYQKYCCRVSRSVPCEATDLVIFPEIYTSYLDRFAPRAQNGIWWLSVDNNKGQYFASAHNKDVATRHFYQSIYALEYLKKHLDYEQLRHCYQLFEYISKGRIILPEGLYSFKEAAKQAASQYICYDRTIDVVYNPVKGKHFTDEIIEQAKRTKSKVVFHPIAGKRDERLSADQVTSLLKQSKVYIDFGPHPGMDRIPREAALAGCIVITNKNGAANYDKDVPIPSQYKFEKFDSYCIVECIEKCVNDYESKREEFNDYRKWIASQYEEMEDYVKNIILELSKS